jgi:hypothetical protein
LLNLSEIFGEIKMTCNLTGRDVGLFVILTIAALVSLLSAASGSEQTKPDARSLTVSVDPRVELMSIIFRLARNPEYNQGRFISYIAAVEKQFGSYRKHPVVQLAAALRGKYGVSFDAPMSLAVYLDDVNSLRLKVPLEPRPDGLDERWHPNDVRDFLEKARQFVKESKFDDFVKSQQPVYSKTVADLQSLLKKEAHLEWFDDFFGARPGAEFHIALGMVNGPSNYGPHIKLGDKEEYYCILGVWKVGFWGLGGPKFDKTVLPTIIHEFCHSYANQIVGAHLSQLEKPGKKIFEKVGEKMKRMAYGNWQTMMRESLVRACVVRYLATTYGPEAAQRQIKSEINNGFLWMQELSDLLVRYEQDREQYKTIDAFFPKIVDFFNNYNLN